MPVQDLSKPIKGNFDRISGMILSPVKNNTVFIRTDLGTEQRYEARGLDRTTL